MPVRRVAVADAEKRRARFCVKDGTSLLARSVLDAGSWLSQASVSDGVPDDLGTLLVQRRSPEQNGMQSFLTHPVIFAYGHRLLSLYRMDIIA